jgi:hypothetical protein
VLKTRKKNTSAATANDIAVTEGKSVMQSGDDNITAGRENIVGIDEKDNEKN